MYAFHHQSGCEEESGFVPSCEVIAQLPFAQHAQSVTYSISNHHMVLTLLYTALGAVVVPRKQPKV